MGLRRLSPVMVVWLLACSITLSGQTNQARLMGVVTDGSGAALPGVTVTVQAGQRTAIAVVTDGAGRYLTPWMAPGLYNLSFALSGFEGRSVSNIPLDAGQTIVLDQQLALAALSETVQVTAPAPPPPPPPAPPPPSPPPPPRAKPVDKEILASVCVPRQATDFSLAVGKIVSRHDDPNRQLMGPGDLLLIDAGEKQGVAPGQNLVVRRRFQTGDRNVAKKLATFAEQSAGLVQVLETQRDSSVAIVVYVCGELLAGDTVEPYVAQPAFYAVTEGTPRFDAPARITTGEHGMTAAAAGQMMVIDHGIMQGVRRGQRLTIFRRPAGTDGPAMTIGDGVVIAIRADSATIRIERATDAVMVGDLVALHR
jgi:hypothetical protein